MLKFWIISVLINGSDGGIDDSKNADDDEEVMTVTMMWSEEESAIVDSLPQ